MLEKWHRFRNRPRADRALVLLAAVLLLLSQAGLSLFGFGRWKKLVERLSVLAHSNRPLTDELQRDIARRVARAVRSAELHGPTKPTCLERSMTLWWLLRREGVDGELHIGGRKKGARFEAHSWVEVGGQVLNDAEEVRVHYASFDAPIGAAQADSRAAGKPASPRVG